MKCYVLSCGVKRGEVESDVLFFSFPKDLELQKVWKKFTQRTDPFIIKSARICSAHFLPAIDYKTGYFDLPCGFRLLKDDAAPRKNPQQDFEMMEMQMKEEAAARVKILLSDVEFGTVKAESNPSAIVILDSDEEDDYKENSVAIENIKVEPDINFMDSESDSEMVPVCEKDLPVPVAELVLEEQKKRNRKANFLKKQREAGRRKLEKDQRICGATATDVVNKISMSTKGYRKRIASGDPLSPVRKLQLRMDNAEEEEVENKDSLIIKQEVEEEDLIDKKEEILKIKEEPLDLNLVQEDCDRLLRLEKDNEFICDGEKVTVKVEAMDGEEQVEVKMEQLDYLQGYSLAPEEEAVSSVETEENTRNEAGLE